MNSSPERRVLRSGTVAASAPAIFDPIDLSVDNCEPEVLAVAVDVPTALDPFDLEAAINEGFRRGYEAGHSEGLRVGRAEGYLLGHDQGKIAGEEAGLSAAVERTIPIVEMVQSVHDQLVAADTIALDAITAEVIEVSIATVEAILGRELELAATPVRDAVARALRLAPERRPVVVRTHPDDLSQTVDLERLAPGRTFDIVSDPAVERGGAIIEVGQCAIDAQVAPALERVRVALMELTLQ
jgi:flagellar assembly protein FliH